MLTSRGQNGGWAGWPCFEKGHTDESPTGGKAGPKSDEVIYTELGKPVGLRPPAKGEVRDWRRTPNGLQADERGESERLAVMAGIGILCKQSDLRSSGDIIPRESGQTSAR